MSSHPAGFSSARWHIVTGKGGTGKTTIAAALAIHLAQGGRRVLLAEIEGRNGIARLLDVPPLRYVERELPGLAGGAGDIYGIAVDAESALLDYLEIFYRLGAAGKALRKLGAIDFASTIAPGVRDILLIGKIFEAIRRKDSAGHYEYDAVVLDAPPTGRIQTVLAAAGQAAELVKRGPIKRHGDLVMNMLTSDVTMVHLATLAEELPITETIQAATQLRKLGLRLGGVVVNRLEELPVPAGRITRTEITRGLRLAQLPRDRATVSALVGEVASYREQVASAREQVARLGPLHLPQWNLPVYCGPIDADALAEFSRRLGDQIQGAS